MFARSENLILRLPDRAGVASKVECGPTLREVSGKRASYLASWDGRQVFVKLFFHRTRARQHWQREKAGIEILASRALRTPKLLYAGRLPEPQAYVLITEALHGALTLAQAWARTPSIDQKLELLRRAAAAVADQHQAAVLQSDLHADNLLIAQNGQIYSIDTSGVRAQGAPIARNRSLASLGLLLAQVEPGFDAHAATVLAAYDGTRNWQTHSSDLQLLCVHIDRAREQRKKQFMKKIFRECTAFARRARADTKLIYDKHYGTEEFLELYKDPERYFDEKPGRYLKKGNTCTIVRAQIDGAEVVLKRYNIKGAWHGVKRALRRTRASISWQNAQLLRFYGIDTPQPIAFIERGFGRGRHASYFISEYVSGRTCSDYFRDATVSSEDKRRAGKRIGEMLTTLARFRIRHGDMKATNIIIGQNRTYLVDLDGMREYRTANAYRRGLSRDLDRFRRNWQAEQWQYFEETVARLRSGA
jgi:tRNA A-37 threonylcarbamoyl transferase component Bud32